MTKKRWTVEDKAKIVMESLTTSTSTVDICKKYGLPPNTFYPWREKFLDGGKAALAGGPSARIVRAAQKENATLKTLVGEITLANDLLKKSLGVEEKMTIVYSLLEREVSLKLCGVAKKRRYRKPGRREAAICLSLLRMMREIRDERPSYGTRRVAAEASKSTDGAVGRRAVRRICRMTARDEPQHSRTAKTRWTPTGSDRPNEFWVTGTTHVRRGPVDGRRFCFNVPDIFTRQWFVCRSGTPATADVAIESLEAAAAKPDCPRPTIPARQRLPVRGQKVPKGRLPSERPPKIHPHPHAGAERPHQAFTRNPQSRIRLAARLLQPPAGRGSHARSVPGPRPEQAALCPEACPAGRFYGIM